MLCRKLDAANEIVITAGAIEGILCACMAFLEPGDEVILFEPAFDQYMSSVQMAGGVVRSLPLYPPPRVAGRNKYSSSEWCVDFKQLGDLINPRTRMMIVNSPHNPVGKVFSRPELLEIGELCVQHDILILSDEVYDRLCYTKSPFTRIATLSPELRRLTLTLGSAGKAFWATGWRVGWVMGSETLMRHVAAAHTRICFSVVSPLQEAVAMSLAEADKTAFWEQSKTVMKTKMDDFNEVWQEIGLPV